MIVQVCPPGSGGVRDYADCLARAWAPRAVDARLIEGVRETMRPQLEALLRAGADASPLCVVLHFSGYGYAPRGLCAWLADELSQFKSAHGARVRLVVVFHELFATGAPWRSAFWLSPLQAQVARRLARLANSLWTNTEHHASWLRGVVGDAKSLQTRQVFSNIDEPDDLGAWRLRRPRAIVFGSAATRARAFGALIPHAHALARLGVEEIVEAGDGQSQAGAFCGPPMRHLGRLSSTALSALLAGSRFGLLDYPARHLGKSGVFAAYAAHACTTLNTFALGTDTDGLRTGVHYVNLRAPFEFDLDTLAATALTLQRWYSSHSLALQARELLQAAEAH
ncbi:MAG: hypothetical protein ABIR54_22925 [Burkholderiaceae bacterium]